MLALRVSYLACTLLTRTVLFSIWSSPFPIADRDGKRYKTNVVVVYCDGERFKTYTFSRIAMPNTIKPKFLCFLRWQTL